MNEVRGNPDDKNVMKNLREGLKFADMKTLI